MKFGGGKVIRDGMGQSQLTSKQGAVDTVITNALILDHWGIIKADVAIKDGRIAGIGKAGNPDIQPGVTIIIGPAPRSSPVKARFSPPAASTRTFISSVRSRSTKPDVRRHNHARRRHRPRRRHQCHHLHAGAVASRAHDPGGG